MKNIQILASIIALSAGILSSAQPRDSTLKIKESVITAVRKSAIPKAGTGFIEIPETMIGDIPSLLGEADLLKTIQLLPGVNPGTEGFSGLYVRGGGPDENLLILDGIPVYSAGHMLGLFSVFQEEAVGKATLYKGSFPARYGGRVSSIIDISSRESAADRIHGSVGVGLLSDKFHAEGPLLGKRTTFSVSGRGMHTFLMDGAFQAFKLPANYHFHDLKAKVSSSLDSGNILELSYFKGNDNLYFKEEGNRTDITWGNRLGSVVWKRRWNDSLVSNTTFGISGYRMDFEHKVGGGASEFLGTGITDLVARSDLVYLSDNGHGIGLGAEIIRHGFLPEGSERNERETKEITGLETAFYVEDGFRLDDRFSVEAGLRLELFSTGRWASLSPEPRLSISGRFGEMATMKMSYSRMSQYVHLLSPPVTTLPMDIWVPVTRNTKPEYSDQLAFGLDLAGPKGWALSLQCYWKSLSNILEYRDGIVCVDNYCTWEEKVACGIGRSKGMEILARKTSGNTTGWLGYTLSSSERKFPDGSISGGEWFPSRYDSRHCLTFFLSQRLGRQMDAGITWTYVGGGAISMPDKDGNLPHRGNHRLPPSHRLDLGWKHHKVRKHGERIWNVCVYNAYNRKNPNIVFLVPNDMGEDGPGSLKTVSIFRIIPSVSYARVF